MDPTIVYKCTGSCGGSTFEAGLNCSLDGCDMHGERLTKCMQCDSCEMASEGDGQPHACDMCPAC